MPSLSQYGDAESYQIGEPEETAEWYEHDETGNQTQVYEPKGSAETESARRLGTVIEGIPGVGDFLGEMGKFLQNARCAARRR